jgi:Spy/CpxP family protein refolding chaperone
MKKIRLLAVTPIFLVVLTATAQQSSRAPRSVAQDEPPQRTTASNAEEHLRMLSESLNLTAEQQEKLRPIIQNMLEERQRLMRDQSLSAEQREQKQRALHEKADHEARKFLNDEQKKKLDALEAQQHAQSAAHTRATNTKKP